MRSLSVPSSTHELLLLWPPFIYPPKRCPVPLSSSAKGALRSVLPPCLLQDMCASNAMALVSE